MKKLLTFIPWLLLILIIIFDSIIFFSHNYTNSINNWAIFLHFSLAVFTILKCLLNKNKYFNLYFLSTYVFYIFNFLLLRIVGYNKEWFNNAIDVKLHYIRHSIEVNMLFSFIFLSVIIPIIISIVHHPKFKKIQNIIILFLITFMLLNVSFYWWNVFYISNY